MIRTFRTLGMAFIACLALSAVGATAASAEGEYTASTYPTTGTGTSPVGNDIFSTEAGSVECNSHFESTLNAANSNLTVKAAYTGCKAFGFASATVNMGSCDYLFTTPVFLGTDEAEEKPPLHTWTIPVDVKCTNAAEPIRITAASCEATVGEQSPEGHVIAGVTTNAPLTPDDVDVQATVTGIKYTVTKDGFLCPFNGTGAKTGATYTQEEAITFKSTNGADIDIG